MLSCLELEPHVLEVFGHERILDRSLGILACVNRQQFDTMIVIQVGDRLHDEIGQALHADILLIDRFEQVAEIELARR